MLSALHLSVWLLNDRNIQLLHMDQHFALAFGTKQRKNDQNGIRPDHNPRFALADRAQQPVFVQHIITFLHSKR
jgi:hypothetical protein